MPVRREGAAGYTRDTYLDRSIQRPRDDRPSVRGSPTEAAVAARAREGQSLGGREQITYLGTGRSSWLALASSVATHMGLGRDPSGTWVAFLVAALMLAIAALATRLALGELDD